MDIAALKKKIILILIAVPIVFGLFFFLPAGTLNYWQAWMYIATILLPALFVITYFLKNDPEFLERRLRTKEKETTQKKIISAGMILFLIGFLLPGLDQRFGWSNMPAWISILADIIVFFGYVLVFLVFKENAYAGRTVEVEKGQKVISTGPYSIVRHPMYVGVLLMYLTTPIALGSYVAFIPFLLIVPIIIIRIFNEEEVLRRDLPGYVDYCKKTKYRLIPYIW